MTDRTTKNTASAELQGRVALVTGAGRGIGAVFAEALATAGAHVVINDIRSELAEATCRHLRAMGLAASASVFDVTDDDAAKAATDRIVADHGSLDILVNNAGVLIRSPIETHTMERWNKVIGVNLGALFGLARHCIPHMQARRWGRIINISSVMGVSARPGVVSYVAAKHGVVGLTRALAAEVGKDNITVNAIAPGFFETELNRAVMGAGSIQGDITRRISLDRWGKPEELAGPVVFLASQAASYVTGHVLVVDGGMTANVLLTEATDTGLVA